ncbi:MAG: ATP-binding cassette domain-containing protein, partial [bacterium]|nr:ATP-binding cassette domain-containing protein [bacterium]
MSLLKITDLDKHIGVKQLYKNLNFVINEREKVALIGRNGFGKSTLFRIIAGEDKDFGGEIERKKNTRIVVTQQEHYFDDSATALWYVL